MKYYYDIFLNFNEYPINYYEWSKEDSIERYLKVPVFRVDNISDFIKYHMKIELNISPFILSDGINAIAIELIDKKVAYLSYLSYEDESCVNEIASNLDITSIQFKKGKVRKIPFELRSEILIKRVLLKQVEESIPDLIKYIYYDITGSDNDKTLEDMKEFLMNDITNNFNDKYVNLYQNLCQ